MLYESQGSLVAVVEMLFYWYSVRQFQIVELNHSDARESH